MSENTNVTLIVAIVFLQVLLHFCVYHKVPVGAIFNRFHGKRIDPNLNKDKKDKTDKKDGGNQRQEDTQEGDTKEDNIYPGTVSQKQVEKGQRRVWNFIFPADYLHGGLMALTGSVFFALSIPASTGSTAFKITGTGYVTMGTVSCIRYYRNQIH